MPERPELHMERFNGLEIYEIEEARWNLYHDEEDGKMNLWLSVACGEAIKQFDDTEEIGGEPQWELNLVEPKLTEAALVPGFRAAIPDGHDESRGGCVTNFYFAEHDGSDKNTIDIIKTEGSKLLIRLTGEIVDVNYYDDSKSRSKLLVETWFDRDPDGRRSMS